VYTWTDIALDFGVDPEGDRVYSTVNREEFERYRSRDYYDGTDLAHQIPLLVTVRDGVVVSVEERFMFTI
jgi:ketosteroid isomerase-like protein